MANEPSGEHTFPILDDSQAEAASTPAGPVVVLGPAGSGKTAVVVERAAWLVGSGVPRESILVMPLSRRNANELTRLLAARLGSGAPSVTTVHAVASRMVLSHHGKAGYERPPRFLSARETWAHLRRILEREDPSLWKHHAGALRSRTLVALLSDLVSGAASNAMEPPEVETAIEKMGRSDLLELARFHGRYQERLKREALLDLEGAVAAALRLLETQPDLLARYRRLYPHLLVDEFEEAGCAQARLTRLLGGDGLFVAGNPREATNSYRGGSPAYLNELAAAPGVTVMRLSTCHRSAPAVQQACRQLFHDTTRGVVFHDSGAETYCHAEWGEASPHGERSFAVAQDDRSVARDDSSIARDDSSIARDDSSIARDDSSSVQDGGCIAQDGSPVAHDDGHHQKLWGGAVARPEANPSGSVTVQGFPHQKEESLWLAKEILSLIRKGVNPEEVAVLFRTGSDPVARDLYRRLARLEIPAQSPMESISVGADPLVGAAVEVLRFLLAAEGEREALFLRLLGGPLSGITRAEVRQLRRLAREHGITLLELATALKTMESLPRPLARSAADLASRLKFAESRLDGPPAELLWQIWITFPAFARQSLAWARGPGVDRGGAPAAFRAFLEEVARIQEDTGSISANDVVTLYDAGHFHELRIGNGRGEGGGVLLATLHQSRGGEWQHVFLPNLVEGNYPLRRSPVGSLAPLLLRGGEGEPATVRERHLAEERRLLYVGLSRAREAVHLTHSTVAFDGTTRLTPSRYLAALGSAETRRVDGPPQPETPEELAIHYRRRLRGASVRSPAVSNVTLSGAKGLQPDQEMLRFAQHDGAVGSADRTSSGLPTEPPVLAASVSPSASTYATPDAMASAPPSATALPEAPLQDHSSAEECELSLTAAEALYALKRLAESFPERVDPSQWWDNLEETRGASPPYPDGKLYLSASRLAAYRDCPLAYKFSQHLKLEEVSSDAMTLGTLLHDVLQEYHRPEADHPRSRETLDGLLDRFFDPGRFSRPAVALQVRRKLSELLDQYFPRYGQATGVVATEIPFRFELGPHIVSGRIDRIDRLADGSLELIDYKTGSSIMSHSEAASDLQLALYTLAFQHDLSLAAHGSPSRATYLFIKGIGPRADGRRSYEPTEEGRRALLARIDRYARGILSELFPSRSRILETWSDLDPEEVARAQKPYDCDRLCAYHWLCPEMERGMADG